MDSIVIHSLKDCYYCEKAKEYLDSINKEYSVVNYNKDDESYQQQLDELVKITDYRKFPQIFVNGDFIGGFKELTDMYDF